MYSRTGRPSIPPEKLLKGLLLQTQYIIRSNRLLVEQIGYNVLFRWFLGLVLDETILYHSSFSTNQERLIKTDAARKFLTKIVEQARKATRLIIDGMATRATGTAEREAAAEMVASAPGGDKSYDTRDFVKTLREHNATPHVSQNNTKRSSAIDGRTTRHEGYKVSQKIRKRIAETFGWIKTIGNLRKTRYRGVEKVDWYFILTASAYNLLRMRNPGEAAS
jgi:IS5 family transposase